MKTEDKIRLAITKLPEDLQERIKFLQVKEDDQMNTIGVDLLLTALLYNREYIDSKTVDETLFAVANVAMHARRIKEFGAPNKLTPRYRAAIDYVHNAILVERGIGTRPDEALYNEAYKGMLVEQVLELLKNDKTLIFDEDEKTK